MRNTCFLLLLGLLSYCSGVSQVSFRTNLEFGFGAGGKPEGDSYAGAYSSYDYSRSVNRYGMAGLNVQCSFGRFFQVQTGLLWHHTNQLYDSEVYYKNVSGPGGWETKYHAARNYHRLVVPISAGLGIGKGKVRPSIHAGARLGYFLLARNHVDYNYVDTDPTPEDSSSTTDASAFNGGTGNRFHLQVLVRGQVELGGWIYLGLQWAIGRTVEGLVAELPSWEFRNREISFFLGVRVFKKGW
jgi:hypothetical protein